MTTTIKLPLLRGEPIGDYLIARFLEKFGTDEIILQYIKSWRKTFDKELYMKVVDGNGKWVISVSDYQEFLNELRKNLPKKYNKTYKWAGYDKVVPIVDAMFWPVTHEQAALRVMEIPNKN